MESGIALSSGVMSKANDPLTAIAVGVVSGLAATGSHEIAKQLSVKDDESNQQ